MAGKPTDWNRVVDRINKHYQTNFSSVTDALEFCIAKNFGSTRACLPVTKTSTDNLNAKCDELGIIRGYKYREQFGVKPMAHEIRKIAVCAELNYEAWKEDGKRRSPCFFCTHKNKEKKNATCEECEAVMEYTGLSVNGLSKLGVDSIESTEISGIGGYYCGR